jgi:hypothetical protein
MTRSQSHLLLAVLNIIFFLVVVVINALATTIPLGGKTTGQLSDQYPNLFVPSGLTFSIWGVIYILLAIYVTYGLIHSIRMPEQADSFMQQISILFIITCIANIGWILAWQYEVLPLSLVCMAILLVTLAVMYGRLNIGISQAGPAEKYMVHMPISVYFGWITVATIANVTALLVAYKWNRFGLSEQIWAVLMIGIGTGLALWMLFNRKDVFYALVVDWAVIGILIKRTAESKTAAQGVITTSIICICVISLALLVQIARVKVYR